MNQSNQQSSPIGLLIVVVLFWLLSQGVGGAPIAVPGVTALYLEETGDRSQLTRDQLMIFTARGPGSVRAELSAAAHKTDGAADVRFVDQDDDVSKDIPVVSKIRARWEAAGRPVPWRYLSDGKTFFEGTPTSTADELAKLRSLQ